MKPGNRLCLTIIFYFILSNFTLAEEKIVTTPLINVEKIKPSFEEPEQETDDISSNKKLKEKKNNIDLKSSQAILIGLDKITAKSSKLIINLNEIKKFGPLK